jgi:hypothetical protein
MAPISRRVRKKFGLSRDRDDGQSPGPGAGADPIDIQANCSTIFLSVWANWRFPLFCFVEASATKHSPLRRNHFATVAQNSGNGPTLSPR